MIDNLEISQDKNLYMAYSGNAELLKNEFYIFLSSLSQNNIDIARPSASILSNLIHYIYKEMNSENIWLAVSASQVINKAYRWHTDVSFRYDAATNHSGFQLDLDENQCAYKKEYFTLFTLKGSNTVFYNLDHGSREKYIDYSHINNQTEKQERINSIIDESKISVGKLGKGYLSLNGAHFGALHSRPSHSSERIFIAFGEIDSESLKFFASKNKA
jgi:hypothetical protein